MRVCPMIARVWEVHLLEGLKAPINLEKWV